jgi:hypothetical protein
MVGLLNEGGFVPATYVREVLRVHNQPDAFYGIEVRGIRREIERFEEVPIKTLPFMPGSIVEDEDVVFPGKDDRSGSLIEDEPERIGIAVACLDGKELACARTDGTQDIQPDMLTIMDHSGIRSLHCPASPRLRSSIEPRLIPVSELYLWICRKIG